MLSRVRNFPGVKANGERLPNSLAPPSPSPSPYLGCSQAGSTKGPMGHSLLLWHLREAAGMGWEGARGRAASGGAREGRGLNILSKF